MATSKMDVSSSITSASSEFSGHPGGEPRKTTANRGILGGGAAVSQSQPGTLVNHLVVRTDRMQNDEFCCATAIALPLCCEYRGY